MVGQLASEWGWFHAADGWIFYLEERVLSEGDENFQGPGSVPSRWKGLTSRTEREKRGTPLLTYSRRGPPASVLFLSPEKFSDVHQKEKTNSDLGIGDDCCGHGCRDGARYSRFNTGDWNRCDCRSLFDLDKTMKLIDKRSLRSVSVDECNRLLTSQKTD